MLTAHQQLGRRTHAILLWGKPPNGFTFYRVATLVVKAPEHGEHIWALIGPGKYLIQNMLEREVNNDTIFVKAEDAVPGIEGYIFDARVLEPPVVKRVCDNWGFACNIYNSIAPAA